MYSRIVDGNSRKQFQSIFPFLPSNYNDISSQGVKEKPSFLTYICRATEQNLYVMDF